MLFFTLGISFIVYTSSSFIMLEIVGPVMSLILVLVAWSSMGYQGYLQVGIDWCRQLMLQKQVFSGNAAECNQDKALLVTPSSGSCQVVV